MWFSLLFSKTILSIKAYALRTIIYYFLKLSFFSIKSAINKQKVQAIYKNNIPLYPPNNFYLQKQMRSRSKWCFSTLVNNIFVLPCRQWSGSIGNVYKKSREWASTSGKLKKKIAFVSVGEYYHCSTLTVVQVQKVYPHFTQFYIVCFFLFLQLNCCGSIDFPFYCYCWG